MVRRLGLVVSLLALAAGALGLPAAHAALRAAATRVHTPKRNGPALAGPWALACVTRGLDQNLKRIPRVVVMVAAELPVGLLRR